MFIDLLSYMCFSENLTLERHNINPSYRIKQNLAFSSACRVMRRMRGSMIKILILKLSCCDGSRFSSGIQINFPRRTIELRNG